MQARWRPRTDLLLRLCVSLFLPHVMAIRQTGRVTGAQNSAPLPTHSQTLAEVEISPEVYLLLLLSSILFCHCIQISLQAGYSTGRQFAIGLT